MTTILDYRTKVGVKKILFVGAQPSAAVPLFAPVNFNKQLSIKHLTNGFEAYQWLVEVLETEQEAIPDAIMMDYQLLRKDNYQLLRELAKHRRLVQLPFFVCYDEKQGSIAQEALPLGVDDGFARPVDWAQLEQRIDFLTKYKPQLLERRQRELTGEPELQPFSVRWDKRLFDILFASAAIIGLSPFLLVIAIIIKLESRGSVIYRSKRIGRGYQVFHFLKFRSMVQNADQQVDQLRDRNQYANGDEAFFKVKDDPRITRFGRILRKTSLDELPQFFNVLRGEMSIVGNRPLPLYEAEKLTSDDWSQRFLAPAGITGLWQVTKRGQDNMSTEERVQLDVDYANNYSLWYDLRIIAKTIPAMIQKENV